MQLGGGCASGTLYSAGGGNTRMLLTLLAFIAGSVVGAVHQPWWSAMPAIKPISLVTVFGVTAALAVNFAVFGLLTLTTVTVERKRHGRVGDDRGRKASSFPGGPMAACRRCRGIGRCQYRDAVAVRPSLGRHVRVRLVGLPRVDGTRRGRGGVALLVGPCAGGNTPRANRVRCDVDDERRHHAGCAGRGRLVGTVRSRLASIAAIGSRGHRRRTDARVRCAHRVRLQHRGVFQRHRFGKRPWLGVARRRLRRQRRRHAPPSILRGRKDTKDTKEDLAARGESPTAFGRRCIPADCVAPPSNIPDILGRRALSAGRLAALGATPDFHHGLLGHFALCPLYPLCPMRSTNYARRRF